MSYNTCYKQSKTTYGNIVKASVTLVIDIIYRRQSLVLCCGLCWFLEDSFVFELT